MRLPVLLTVCLSLAPTSLLNGAQFSKTRDLPPLKLAASELDAILTKIHSFIEAANAPEPGEGLSRETVKLELKGRRSRFLTSRSRAVLRFQTKFSGSLTRTPK